MEISKQLISGSDIWLNVPQKPLEACGTSGMKAALNGCLNLSTYDGWWIEGVKKVEKSGWIVGSKNEKNNDKKDAASIYDLLEKEIIPLYYEEPDKWYTQTKQAMTLMSQFNSKTSAQKYLDMWNS